MKKILSVISIILVIATLFTVTGCSKKEAETNPTDNTTQTEGTQSDNTENKVEDKENYELDFVLNSETKQGFKIKISNKYKDIIDVVRKNNDKEIYFVHKATNLIAFEIIVSDTENKDAVHSTKIDGYMINVLKGDEVNKESADGKVIAEIQDTLKSIGNTITEVKGVETSTENKDNEKNDENKKEETNKNETTVPTPDELKDAEIGQEVPIGGNGSQDTAVKNEDGSITYYYIDENGEKQSHTVKPQKPKPDPDKPIGNYEIDG